MKQNILIATLLAAMLALAGCGGGSGSTEVKQDPPTDPKDKQIADLKQERDDLKNDAEKQQNEANQASYTALFAALNTLTSAAMIPTHNMVAQSKTKGKSKSAKISMEGPAYEKAGSQQFGDRGPKNDLKPNLVVFDDVSVGPTKTYKPNGLVDHDGDSSTQEVAGFEVTGEYRGVAGTFTCTGTTCTSRILADGNLDLAGQWAFSPTDKTQKIEVDDLATFGWWTDTPAGGLEAGYFSSRAEAIAIVYTGGGSATYKGEALGQYVMSADDYGAFTAMATLTATFAGQDKLEGMIHDFKGADGKNRDDWEIKLHETEIAADGAFTAKMDDNTNRQAAWHIGDKKGNGLWNAALYGGGATNAFPTHVAGEFTAQHGITGRMIGAFGAGLESN